MLEHLRQLHRVGYFMAPPTGIVTPATIPDNVECVEVLTGGVIYFEENGMEREYRRGTVFWHLSGEKTIWKTTPQEPYRCVAYTFGVSERIRSAPRVSTWSHPEEAADFSEASLKTFHSDSGNPLPFAAYCYSTLLWNALSNRARTLWPAALQQAIDYIHHHWRDPVDIEELAEESHVSKPYLHALFREHVQVSPHQYLLRYRINRAKLLLANSDTAIKEIALSCGFASLEVFYRQFRKVVALSPHEYRTGATPYGFRPRAGHD